MRSFVLLAACALFGALTSAGPPATTAAPPPTAQVAPTAEQHAAPAVRHELAFHNCYELAYEAAPLASIVVEVVPCIAIPAASKLTGAAPAWPTALAGSNRLRPAIKFKRPPCSYRGAHLTELIT